MIFLMDLPKPIHGMSNVNLAMLNKAIEVGLSPKVINTIPSYAAKYFTTKLWVVFKVFHSTFCFFRLFIALVINKKRVIYRPVNGGVGQVYDIFYIILCRLFFYKIYIHHHSFNYFNSQSLLFSLLNKLAGRSATHIVLGKKMKELLSNIYAVKRHNIKILSNFAYFSVDEFVDERQPESKLILGHLSNLSFEKGTETFLKTCLELKMSNISFEARIAGPFVNSAIQNMVLSVAKEVAEIKYIGAVYAKDKEIFYQDLDIFILPSKNEAEPLVLYEAAQFGTYLMGTDCGCMGDVITSLKGFAVKEDDDVFVDIANRIKQGIQQGMFTDCRRTQQIEIFKLEQVKSKKALELFVDELCE